MYIQVSYLVHKYFTVFQHKSPPSSKIKYSNKKIATKHDWNWNVNGPSNCFCFVLNSYVELLLNKKEARQKGTQ